MTTINAANISIGFDASKLKIGEDLTRQSMNQLRRNLNASVPDGERFRAEVEQLSIAYKKGAIDAERYAAAYETVAKKYNVVTDAVRKKIEADKAEAEALQLKQNQQKFDEANQQRGLMLTKLVATGTEKHAAAIREYTADLRAGIIDQATYNRLIERSAQLNGIITPSIQAKIDAENRDAEAKKRKLSLEREHQANLIRGRELTRSVETATERHARAVREYSEDLRKGIINQTTYNRLIQRSGESLGIATEKQRAHNIEQAKSSTGGGGALAGLAMRFGGPAVFGAGAIQSIKLAAGIETATVAFEVMLGSAQRATQLIADMRKLDAASPVNFGDISQAGKTLLAFGMEADKVMPTMTALSQISLGNGERFKSLSLAMGQVSAAGRLMGQEVLQMVNGGFNPLQQIAKDTGRSMKDLKKDMEEGRITAEMVHKALQNAVSEGGRYYQMNDRLVKTTSGQWAKLTSDIQQLGINTGKILDPVSKMSVNAARGLVVAVNNVATPAARFVSILEGTHDWGHKHKSQWDDIKKKIDETSSTLKQIGNYNRIHDTTSLLERGEAARVKFEERKKAASKGARDALMSDIDAIDQEFRRSTMSSLEWRKLQLQSKLSIADRVTGDTEKIEKAINQLEELDRKKKTEEDTKKRDEEAKRLREQISEEQSRFAKWQNESSPKNMSESISPAVRAGTVEAYKLMLDRDSAAKRDAQEQARKQQEHNDRMIELQQKLVSINENAPRLVKMGG